MRLEVLEYGRSTQRTLQKLRGLLDSGSLLQLKAAPLFISFVNKFWEWVFNQRVGSVSKNNSRKLEFGNHWSCSNPSFSRWELGLSVKCLVPDLKKRDICIIILSIYKKSFSSPGRCIVFWSTGCCSGHDSVFSVVILCSLQRPNAGCKSHVPLGGCLLLHLPFLWLTCAFSLVFSFAEIQKTDRWWCQ